MKAVAFGVLFLLIGLPSLAQSPAPASVRSVWIRDYSPEALRAAVTGGKTTLVYSGGSSLSVGNHVEVAKHVARRVAQELGNALVLPIVPDSPAATDSAYTDVMQAVGSAGFTSIFVIADEGRGRQDTTLEALAKRLNEDLKAKRIPVHYITAHEIRPGQDMTFNSDYLRRWAGRTVKPERRKAVEDAAELLAVDPQRKWLRPEMIAVEDRPIVNAALGNILLEERVSSILNQIRMASPSHLRAPSSVVNPQNRLTGIPENQVSEALRNALADYKQVRPDGLASRGGAVGAGGPSLWTVYVHLPEILEPLRKLHEQAHVNPRISQKLVHFVIMITARYWTNDIWTAHEEDSIKEGLGRDTVKALIEGRHPDHMTEDEEIVYAFCTELLENRRVSDATYARAVAKFGEEGVVQVAVIEGLYTYMSMAVNMAYPESAGHGRLAPFPQ